MKDDFLITSGKDFPDSLSAGGAVAKNKQTLALSNGQDLPMINYKGITLLGGPKALPLPGISAKRIGGDNRYDTALMLAKENFEKPETIILASGENFPDALTAVSLAAKYDAPILLSRKDVLDPNTLTYIQENCEDLIIVGGNAAIDINIPTQEPEVKKNEAIITFVPNFEKTPITVKTTVGGKTTAPLINRNGYTLKGWNTKADGSGKTVDFSKDTFSDNTVLYGIWEKAEIVKADISVTFKYNYFLSPSDTVSKIKTGAKAAAPSIPQRKDYSFKGWNTKADGSGEMVNLNNKTFSEDTILYAVWESADTAISFDYNYQGAPRKTTQYINSSSTVTTPNEPVRQHYKLKGWSTNPNGYGLVDLQKETFSRDTILYAVWERIEISIVFDYNYENAPEDHVISINSGENAYYASYPGRRGYEFIGWSTKSNDAGAIVDLYNQTFSQDTTLYAIWAKEKINIIFHYNDKGVTEPTVTQIESGATVTPPSNPSRDGYDFIGWTRDYYNERNELLDLSSETFTDYTNLFAVWEKKKFEITFDYNYDNSPNDSIQNVEFGNTAAFSEEIIRNGYYIESWNTKEDGSGEEIDLTSKIFTEAATLYAQWREGTSGLVFDNYNQIITGYNGTEYNVVIPSKINGLEVKRIGYNAFSGKRLTSISIPDTVTSIESSAFSNNKLTSIRIPESVETIESSAFSNNLLTSVVLPNSVNTIGSYAFSNNKLASIELPDSITTIASYAFYNNELTSVTIPDSVTSIGEYAFYQNKLNTLSIPSSVKTIGQGAFKNNHLTSISLPNTIRIIEEYVFENNRLESITIPDSVTLIGSYAFSSNNLTSVSIPNLVTIIEESAFEGNLLTSVSLPNSISTIERAAFAHNKLGSLTIPYSVTLIGAEAFSSNALTIVAIPNSVEIIEEFAFAGNKLTGIFHIPPSVDYLGNRFLYGNPGITTIEVHKDRSYLAESFISGMIPEQYVVTQYE